MRDDRLAVIIPSVNRPATLHETLLSVLRQRRLPGQIIVSVPDETHVLPATHELTAVTLIHCAIGSTRQRNGAIDVLNPTVKLVGFIDDDVELHEDYLEHIAHTFEEHPEVVLADGRVLADGCDISRDRAREIVAASGRLDTRSVGVIGPELAYGCNMTVRRDVLAKVRFDERLTLYGYMEDRDFAFECARMGRIVRCDSATLVHLRPSGGRVSARRFGFSQVMNPIYLWRKGNYASLGNVAWQVCRPLLVNAALALAPGQEAKRRNLFAGNCRALGMAIRGRIAPEDVLRL